MNVTRPRNALIIGGGIAGPTAAMALQKVGIEAVVYEAHATSADGIGEFLTLATNGVHALRTLDADRSAIAAGFPITTMSFWSGTGKHLGETPVSITLEDGTTGYTLKRADLYGAIRDQARARGIRFEHGKRLLAADNVEAGVRATFADGSQATADILVGADGVHSSVRSIIDPHAPAPKYAGLLNVGGFVRGVDVPASPGTYHMIFGKRAFFGYALAPHGEVWWFANLPEPHEPARGSLAPVSIARRSRNQREAFLTVVRCAWSDDIGEREQERRAEVYRQSPAADLGSTVWLRSSRPPRHIEADRICRGHESLPVGQQCAAEGFRRSRRVG